MDTLLDPENKSAQEFLIYPKIQDGRRGSMSKNDQIWTHKLRFASAFGSCSLDLDKIWHEHTTWPFKQACASISRLLQNPRWLPGVKGPKSTKFDPTNSFRLGIWISFIRFGQILAWTYFLTQQTSLCARIYQSSLFVGSISMSMPNFVQIGWMGSKCWGKMWFVESNLDDFEPLTSGGNLGFYPNW